ncbi:MAG: phytanoyl-CoA dioxygenase family protein [Cephaloticoccus sp.]|nr:phytanoyl-CoA dioxygenase family protein [Cephaloticoccus sp.]
MPLTPQQVSFSHDEGFLIIPDLFNPVALEPLRHELHNEINRKAREFQAKGQLSELHEEEGLDRQISAIYRDAKECGAALVQHLIGERGGAFLSPEMFNLIINRKLIQIISSLLGSEEIVASAHRLRPKLPHLGSGDVPWHQDGGYLAEHCDDHLIITCWVPLVDATRENGCMEILPRTHLAGVVRHHAGGNAGFLVIKAEDLPTDPSQAIIATCPRGGAVFMTNRTPHCSTPNISDHIRWSVDLRYKSADVPSNVGIKPTSIDAEGHADRKFYEQVNIACYPPEADFVISSKEHPERVIGYDDYVRLRALYTRTKPGYPEVRAWPAMPKF